MKIEYSTEFKKALKGLHKRYRHIREDVDGFIYMLGNNSVVSDKIDGVGYEVYKARIPNTDSRKGKSGGYRIIYYLRQADHIILITIYSKSDSSDIPDKEIKRIIQEHLSD